MRANSLQSCPTLCDPVDCSPPGSPCPWVLQARTLEWAAVASSRGCFLIQGSNLSILRLLHCRLILCPWSCLGRPNMCTAAAKSLQSCPTLCDPIDSSPPGSSVPAILQARVLGWVAIGVGCHCQVQICVHTCANTHSHTQLQCTAQAVCMHTDSHVTHTRIDMSASLLIATCNKHACSYP